MNQTDPHPCQAQELGSRTLCKCRVCTGFQQLVAEVDRLTKEKNEAIDVEQARWQERIDKMLAPYEVDGSGCDSGDPLDLTATEIELALGKANAAHDATAHVAGEQLDAIASLRAENAELERQRDHARGVAIMEHADTTMYQAVCLERDQLRAERDELAAWKESAMSVTPPLQEIGKALDLPLGVSIHDKILPGILALRTAAEADKERLKGLEPIYRQLCALKMSHPNLIQLNWLDLLKSLIPDAARKEQP